MSESNCSPTARSSATGFDIGCAYTLRDGTPVKDYFNTPASLVNLLIPNLFVIAGVSIIILIMLAGYKFLFKGREGLQDAQKILMTTGFGIVIMFAAYWVIQIIRQITGADIPL